LDTDFIHFSCPVVLTFAEEHGPEALESSKSLATFSGPICVSTSQTLQVPAGLPHSGSSEVVGKVMGSQEFDPYYSHWADIAGRRTLAANPDAKPIVVAAGITPSGVVHVGNFREVITVDLVARALRDHGIEVRFIYSWDDFDVFRKVPKDMPEQAMLEENLRRSVADVPDPFGSTDSYASHFIEQLETSLAPLGIAPEFIRQSRAYRAGRYAEGIRKALDNRDLIRGVLDQFRGEPLSSDWLPLAGFCGSCGRDEIDFSWDGEWGVTLVCRACKETTEVDLREGGDVKLPWRIDWPMRWAYEGVCFEPGGKDHSSAGGSFDTAKQIVGPVYGGDAPEYVAYDFVRIKGRGGKISSSKGEAVTVHDCLEIFEPEMLRWIFASQRPNSEFQISFDLDVIKLYEDYDRAVAQAFVPDDGSKNDKKRQIVRRTIELSRLDARKIEPGDEPIRVPSFRPISMILQIYDGDVDHALAHYEGTGEVETESERDRFRTRARCVWNWIESHAPDEFRYRIRETPSTLVLEGEPAEILARLIGILEANPAMAEANLVPHLKTLCEGTSLTPQDFYPYAYDLLIARPKGPKLTTLLATMGIDRALPLLRAGLA
jgi:lysyl-tRNA synthetase class 1